VLIQRLEAGANLDQVIGTWKGLLGLVAFPEPAGRRQTAEFAWTLYTYKAKDSNLGARKGSIALAETEAGVVLVLPATAPHSYNALHEAVLCRP